MIEILAVQPNASGNVIHFHVPGYQPGKKTRSCVDTSGLCNIGLRPTAQNTAPLTEALSWPDTHKACGCPRPGWVWCRPCLGHAATLAGVVDHVLYLIVQATTPCSCAGRRWVRDEGYQAEFPEDAVTPLRPYKGVIPCGSCNENGDADPVGDEPW
jgi:hypothetical protein